MAGCLLRRLGDDGHVQAPADYLSDVSHRHALVGDPVISGSRSTLLKHEPVEVCSIEPVHRGPAVEPLTHIRRNALFRAMPMMVGTKPWSPSPWTVGGRRITDTCTPRSATEAAACSEARGDVENWLHLLRSRGGPA
jgi:hypothetical protein